MAPATGPLALPRSVRLHRTSSMLVDCPGERRGRNHARQPDEGLLGRHEGRHGHGPRRRPRRVRRLRRPVRLRQDDCAPDDRRPRGHHVGGGEDRRPGRERLAPEGSRHRHGVPELRALPAHERGEEHGLRAEDARRFEGRDRPKSEGGGAHPRPLGLAGQEASNPLGRPAAACGDGARDRPQPAGVSHGRAALEPRREAACRDARGDRAYPA